MGGMYLLAEDFSPLLGVLFVAPFVLAIAARVATKALKYKRGTPVVGAFDWAVGRVDGSRDAADAGNDKRRSARLFLSDRGAAITYWGDLLDRLVSAASRCRMNFRTDARIRLFVQPTDFLCKS